MVVASKLLDLWHRDFIRVKSNQKYPKSTSSYFEAPAGAFEFTQCSPAGAFEFAQGLASLQF